MNYSGIVDVWKDGLHSEFDKIKELVKKYNYIGMDTEFPGVVAKPIGNFISQSNFAYQQVRCNADLLKIIQLGITLSDKDGNMPSSCTWQFNFSFDVETEMYAEESMNLLIEANLDFYKHKEKGIDPEDFGELLLTSGLVLNKEVVWVSFHSAFDFGYLLRLMTGNFLPETQDRFLEYLDIFFNKYFDLKYLLSNSQYLKRGLQEIATSLDIQRIGIAHQAGSDSLLTLKMVFKLNELMFIDLETWSTANKLFGVDKIVDV